MIARTALPNRYIRIDATRSWPVLGFSIANAHWISLRCGGDVAILPEAARPRFAIG